MPDDKKEISLDFSSALNWLKQQRVHTNLLVLFGVVVICVFIDRRVRSFENTQQATYRELHNDTVHVDDHTTWEAQFYASNHIYTPSMKTIVTDRQEAELRALRRSELTDKYMESY
jgi:Cu/Ag efflux pump CusA